MTTTQEIEQLFRLHFPAMHRVAMLLLRDQDAANDIVHDVFAHLLSTRSTDVQAPYLLAAVRNRCLNHIRSLSARERIRQAYAATEREVADDDWPDDETIALIQRTVARDLTPACRRVVELRFSQGLSYKQVAQTLGISEVAVYKHLRHAIDVLRQKLSHNG